MTDHNDNLHKNSKAFAYEYARSLRQTQTKAEGILWEVLRNNKVCNLKFRRQHPFDDYILDFYCHKMKLAIEVDGEVHNDPEVAAYDLARTKTLEETEITVLRFSNDEVEKNIKGVIKKIQDWFEENDLADYGPPPYDMFKATPRINKISKEFVESLPPLSSRRGEGGEVHNRLNKIFTQKGKKILNIYCTAGYPHLNSTIEVMQALQDHGADIIELGMPYSDPLADGPVIQQSSMIALENGMSIPVLFAQLAEMKNNIHIPVVLMGYMNPVLQFGMERFCATAAAMGIDAVILPDLPIHEFETEYRAIFEKYSLHFIFLVTPETNEERTRKIDKAGSGFIYAVSSSSTTGNAKPIGEQSAWFRQLQDMQLKNPVLVGFGIKDAAGFNSACQYTNGGIIGSAYINALKTSSDIAQTTKEFINSILQ